MTTTVTETTEVALSEQLETAEHIIERLSESLRDVELAREDKGWNRIGQWGEEQLTREGLRTSSNLCRVFTLANPLMRRGVALRTSYVWAQGVQIGARSQGPTPTNKAAQNVDDVIQAWLEDTEVRRVLTGAAAHERNERTLATDGNLFVALITNPLTGWVRPRLIPFDEMTRPITNPEDSLDRWFWLREYRITVVEAGTRAGTTRKRTETHRRLHPSIDYRPSTKPDSLEGIPIAWDAPVAELQVNDLPGADFGTGDTFSVLPWVRAYGDFLTDWARLTKALSRIAFQSTSTTKGRAQKAAQEIRQANSPGTPEALPGPRRQGIHSSDAGATVASDGGTRLEAVSKSGATIDADSGRPLAAMVAAGLDVPVTMLLADPGKTGARAVAETLDKPTENMASMRRDVWADFLRRVLGYVIDMSAKAPGGALKRKSMTRDRNTGREVIVLAGETDRTIEVNWPDLTTTPANELMDALTKAADLEVLPPLELLKLAIQILQIPDGDELIADSTDDEGRWIDPVIPAGQAAGQAAANAVRRGGDPAKVL